MENETEDEYHTALASTDSIATLFDSNKNDSELKGYRQLNEQQNLNDFVHDSNDALDSRNRLSDKTKEIKRFDNSKQTSKQLDHLNASNTKSRCDTIHLSNRSNGIHQQQQQQHHLDNATQWRKSHEQIITHKHSRRSTRNSLENKVPLLSCCNHRANEDNKHINSKRSLCKRFQATDYSDSSDVNSETNLVIENMRNRECEMYRKISFNNGYFDTTDSSSSGSNMYCRSNTNSVESTSIHGKNKKCLCKPNKSPKFLAKRKCRSFPLNENRQIHQNSSENVIQNQITSRSNCSRTLGNIGITSANETETETSTFQTNSRKITITIRTKRVPEQIIANQPQQQQIQPKSIENYSAHTNESSEESDTTVSDYATLCSESDAHVKQISESENEHNLNVESSNNDSDSSDDDNSFFSMRSEVEYHSETSQYFNCKSFNDLETGNMHFSTEKVHEPTDDAHFTENVEIDRQFEQTQSKSRTKTVKNPQTKSHKQNKNVATKTSSSTPMIYIEQELCENRIVTSKIEVDKERIKEFKRLRRKRSQPKIIIDNSFSEEIFNKTLNQSAQICCDKTIINEIVSSLEAQKTEKQDNHKTSTKSLKNAQNARHKFISDDFVFDKLHASPNYTGKSISHLLAHRIEQHESITSVRRTLLQNVAYAITEKEKQQKRDKKKLTELAPIKPPRSFTASSSSSPLSKQSFESSATIPISELNQAAIGFVITPSNQKHESNRQHVGEESSVQFGWIRPDCDIDNYDSPTSRYCTADQISRSTKCSAAHLNAIGFCIPREDIDTVDSSNRSTKDFERFSSLLSENRQNNLSTPIKIFDLESSTNNTHFQSVQKLLPTAINQASKPNGVICKNCHCKVKENEVPNHILFGKTGRRIGKAALKRTKTLIGTSKKFLKKSSTKEVSGKKEKKKEDVSSELFSTSLKDGDNTVCNNRDTISQEDCEKRVNKSLNLPPREMNENVVELIPSPKRNAETSNIRLLKDAPKPVDNSDQYVTPDEAFDFDRVVNLPIQNQEKALKRSPSKIILKLAKSSKKLFQMKNRDKDNRRPSTDESTHYYKANDYDEVDNRVSLMGEMLSEMRKRIETGHGSANSIHEEVTERPLSAKKCLFRDRTISTSSGDLLDQDSLVEQIATIDLHDEPEPLYAEIEQIRPAKGHQDTFYRSCQDDDDDNTNAIGSYPTDALQLKEVYISDRGNSQPNRYIMVNNDPKILYATVKRNSLQTRSLETIESRTEQSEDQIDGATIDNENIQLSSSYESLDMSLITDFATAVQTELDQCQFKMNEMFATVCSVATGDDEVNVSKNDAKSNSESESIATSDLNSGCSSFYRRSKNIVSNRPKKSLSDFVDTLSFDTVETGSYCESLSRGNDLNSEIKNTITRLEFLPSEMGDSTDLSNDYVANADAFRSFLTDNNSSKDSSKVFVVFFLKSTEIKSTFT